eukprot:1160007-Pelagomonas_calceolata.AAC.5
MSIRGKSLGLKGLRYQDPHPFQLRWLTQLLSGARAGNLRVSKAGRQTRLSVPFLPPPYRQANSRAHGVQLAGLPLQLRQSRELLRQAGWTLPSSQGVGQASSSSSSSSSGDSNEGEQGAGEAASSRKEGSAGEVHEVREAGEAGEAYKAYAAGQAGEAHEAGAASGGDAGETEHSSEAAAVAAPEAVGAGKTDAPSSVTSSSSKGSSTERGTLLDLVTAGLSTDMNVSA